MNKSRSASSRRRVAKPVAASDVSLQVLDARYPARLVLDLIADKWTPIILYCLSAKVVRRFNELQRTIPHISKKMLIQTLRRLERDGFVERTVYPEVPPRTDYRLTEAGHKIREPIAWICEWATDNQGFIEGIHGRREHPRSDKAPTRSEQTKGHE